MRLLAVPNWSFGRDKSLLRAFRDVLEELPLDIHFLASDIDHNRTVSAFSGDAEFVSRAILELMDQVRDRIDLNRHVGVHPRIGALDVCPIVTPWGAEDEAEVNRMVEDLGAKLAELNDLPVFLYEKSERGKHSKALPKLRRKGFGGLLGQELDSDFGPYQMHPQLGATVLGWRDFLIALNVNLNEPAASTSKAVASRIREERRNGNEVLNGVRALGFPLVAQELSQVSMNLTAPDHTHIDTVVDWVTKEAGRYGTPVAGTELIGVIRDRDLEFATAIEFKPEQVIETI